MQPVSARLVSLLCSPLCESIYLEPAALYLLLWVQTVTGLQSCDQSTAATSCVQVFEDVCMHVHKRLDSKYSCCHVFVSNIFMTDPGHAVTSVSVTLLF